MEPNEIRVRTQAALMDALAPLVSEKGIVSMSIVVLISHGPDVAVPMHIVLGINPVAVNAVVRASAMISSGEMNLGQGEHLEMPAPVKN